MKEHEIIEKVLTHVATSYGITWQFMLKKGHWGWATERFAARRLAAYALDMYLPRKVVCEVLGIDRRTFENDMKRTYFMIQRKNKVRRILDNISNEVQPLLPIYHYRLKQLNLLNP